MSIFRETRDDDERRTSALSEALVTALDERTGGYVDSSEPTEFESVLLEGLSRPSTYPPAGHVYPRRG